MVLMDIYHNLLDNLNNFHILYHNIYHHKLELIELKILIFIIENILALRLTCILVLTKAIWIQSSIPILKCAMISTIPNTGIITVLL